MARKRRRSPISTKSAASGACLRTASASILLDKYYKVACRKMREFRAAEQRDGDRRVRVDLKIDENYASFSDDRANSFVRKLLAIVHAASEVKVIDTKEGGVHLTISGPPM